MRHVPGLELLARNGKISAEQRAAGDRYGKLYRIASIQDVALIKSAIDFSAPGAGGGGKAFPGENDYATAEGVMRARKELNEAQAALGRHSGLIAALDVVCGKEWTAAQISDVRREQEEVVTGLRIGLDLLAKHFREADRAERAA